MPLCILVAGNTVPALAERRGEFAKWIRDGVGDAWAGDWIEVDIRTDAPLPTISQVDGFFITGSSSSVTERAPWMLRAEQYIREIDAAGKPLLGICFGHQLIAQALGGDVQKNPKGREIGTVRVNVTAQDPLFGNEPRVFDANASHVDSVAKVPERARVLASTSLDPVAAFAVGQPDSRRAVPPRIRWGRDAGIPDGPRASRARGGARCGRALGEREGRPSGGGSLAHFRGSLRRRRRQKLFAHPQVAAREEAEDRFDELFFFVAGPACDRLHEHLA